MKAFVTVMMILLLTGVMLMFVYTPTPEQAYNDMLALQTEVWFGQFVRNLHHWSGNAMIVVVFLQVRRQCRETCVRIRDLDDLTTSEYGDVRGGNGVVKLCHVFPPFLMPPQRSVANHVLQACRTFAHTR